MLSRNQQTPILPGKLMLCFLIVFISNTSIVRGQSISEITSAFSESVQSEGVTIFLREAGVEDPSTLKWRDEIDNPQILTWTRFRDVNRDGFPDLFLGLYDERVVHWIFLRALGPKDWGDPKYLSHTHYTGKDIDRDSTDKRLSNLCPRSQICSGRVLVFHDYYSSGGSSMIPDTHEIFELTERGFLPLIVRDTSGNYANRAAEWPMATETPGELLFFRWSENYQDGSRLLYMRRIAPDSHSAGPTEEVTFEHARRLRTLNAPTANKPAINEPTHPEVVAFEIGRSRRESLHSRVWNDIGIDPRSFRLFDLEHETGYPINTAVSYQDIDDDGDPEAWIVLEYLASHYWILMDRDADDHWFAVNMRGSLWIEHGTPHFHNAPPTPSRHNIAGRTILVYITGSTHDLGSEIRSEVYLFEEGKLTKLWDEITFGHQYDTQQLEFSQDAQGGVRLEVITYEDWSTEKSDLKKHRTWVLTAGSNTLEPVAH